MNDRNWYLNKEYN